MSRLTRSMLLFTTLVVVVCFGASGTAFAQDQGTLKILDADPDGPMIVAQSNKRKAKKAKEDDEESEEETGDEEEEETDTGSEATTATLQRGNRMEFDGRLIRGETAGSGAVFLFERAPRALPSLVKTRSSYLSETVQSVFGEDGTEQFETAKVEAMKEIEKKGESDRLKSRKSVE